MKNSPASSHGIPAGEKGHTDPAPSLQEDQVSAGLISMVVKLWSGTKRNAPRNSRVLVVCLRMHIFFPFFFLDLAIKSFGTVLIS